MLFRLMLGGALLSVVSCGQDKGYVFQAKEVQVEDSLGSRTDFELSKSSFKEAVWFLSCDASDEPPVAEPGQMVLSGRSVDAVRENYQGTKVTFQGRVCPPQTYARDVVFVVDVSGSMWYPDSDPIVNNSCKRLTQLESMIAGLPAGSQFGVVAFEEIIASQSTKLFDSKDQLFADLTKNGTTPIADIICGGSGISLFDVGLNAAKSLMLSSRSGLVQKELVVMSDGDGEGSQSHFTAALDLAKDLKTKGITVGGTNYKLQIAGLRVASSQVDRFLQVSASNDLTGRAMVDEIVHGVDVSNRLNAFTLGILDKAEIKYGPAGSANQIQIDLKPLLAADYSFKIENGPFVLDRNQTGYEAVLKFSDTRGNEKTIDAKLKWINAP